MSHQLEEVKAKARQQLAYAESLLGMPLFQRFMAEAVVAEKDKADAILKNISATDAERAAACVKWNALNAVENNLTDIRTACVRTLNQT